MPAPPKQPAEATVTLSVLDRLIDRDPKNSGEAALTRAQSVRELKSAVRRDLESLLNTRRVADEPEESLREVNRSCYVYGLPDFTGAGLAAPRERARLVRSLQATVKLFEPRLAQVQVVPLETHKLNTHTLRFRIEGMLLMNPAPEHVSFDTVLDITSSEYKIKSDSDAG